MEIAELKQIPYQNAVFEHIDCFVSAPKAKRHINAGITHAMKNLVGTLPLIEKYSQGAGNRKAIHSHPGGDNDLCRVILDLNKANPIHLTVIDAVKTTVLGEGPWVQGRNQLSQVTFNRLIAAKNDVVAADAIATQTIGFDPTAKDYSTPFTWDSNKCINYLRLASSQGMGTYDPKNIEVINATIGSS